MSTLSLALDTPDLAHRYDRVSVDRQFRAGKALVAKLGVRPGERVLDVGAGTGHLAEHVARVVGSTGSVLGIDPLPLRIEMARRRAAANLAFEVGDACALDGLPGEHFDVVYLNAVFHWLPEKLAALRHFHRVLKGGGRLGITTTSKEHPNTVQAVRRRVLSREPYSRFREHEQGSARRVTLTELAELFEAARFEVRSIDIEPHVGHFGTAEDAIEFSQASSFGNFLGHLPEDCRDQARREIAAELEKLRTPAGIPHQGARIVALGVKAVKAL
jgi:arsenite methyltransferase